MNDIEEFGSSLPLVTASEDHLFELQEDVLDKILMQEEVKERFLYVVSIAGAQRTGKSLILNYILRYLDFKYRQHDVAAWLTDQQRSLSGFPWRGGNDRQTTGILMWSKVYLHEEPNGDKIAIILLDTQGTFDSESRVKDWATIFGLSTLLSSIQLYNVSETIDGRDLRHLQFFADYARLAVSGQNTARGREAPFGRLLFLVRDWYYAEEYAYGADGGQQLLKKLLQQSDERCEELRTLRKSIYEAFASVRCVLLPHPGLLAATAQEFDGSLRELSPQFQQQLHSLMDALFAPGALICKRIEGERIRAKEFGAYVRSYVRCFQGDELPAVGSLLSANVEADHANALAEAEHVYREHMQTCRRSSDLQPEHLRAQEKAREHLNARLRMGDQLRKRETLGKLQTYMEQVEETRRRKSPEDTKEALVQPETLLVIGIGMLSAGLVMKFGSELLIIIIGMLIIFLACYQLLTNRRQSKLENRSVVMDIGGVLGRHALASML
ncbi:hypothetical protein KR222_005719 [Zaprionus bogoriensis]|nr:hypothetical protein KR222_005719 [Zaprionus bogoriensis]